MKKFLIRLLIFLSLAVVYDYILGLTLDHLALNAKSGQALKNREIAESAAPDILILGSSRSVHHYVPDEIERIMGRSTYIAGQDGNGIVLMDPLLHYISARHKPEIVIYDVTPAFDLYDDDPHRYLRYLRPLWGRNDYVDSVIMAIDDVEAIKLHSNLFRYNSSLFSMLKGLFPSTNFDRGYKPLYGVITDIKNKASVTSPASGISEQKLDLFRDMINFCRNNNIQLYFTVSPIYVQQPNSAIKVFANELNVSVLDYSNDPELIRREYFQDIDHLNHTGAVAYTDKIASRIQSLSEHPLRARSLKFRGP